MADQLETVRRLAEIGETITNEERAAIAAYRKIQLDAALAFTPSARQTTNARINLTTNPGGTYDELISKFTPQFMCLPHQLAFVEFCIETNQARNNQQQWGGVLGDDMGLGKTASMLMAAAQLILTGGASVVVIMAPTPTLRDAHKDNFVAMFDPFSFTSHVVHNTTELDKKSKTDANVQFVFVSKTSISIKSAAKEELQTAVGERGNKCVLFVDEGDLLKQEATSAENNARHYIRNNFKNVWLVTGTAVGITDHGDKSLWLLYGAKNARDAHNRTLRRETAAIDTIKVPAVERAHIGITATPLNARNVKKDTLNCGTGTPYTLYRGLPEEMAAPVTEKEGAIARLCVAMHKQGEQCVVVYQNKWVARRLTVVLLKAGLEAHRDAEDKAISEFRDRQYPVLLLSLSGSNSRGANLQHCKNMIFAQPGLTATIQRQAETRIVRIGSLHQSVRIHHVYYLYSRDDFYWTARLYERTTRHHLVLSKQLDKLASTAVKEWPYWQNSYHKMLVKCANIGGTWSLGEHIRNSYESMYRSSVFERIEEVYHTTFEEICTIVALFMAAGRQISGQTETSDLAIIRVLLQVCLSKFKT